MDLTLRKAAPLVGKSPRALRAMIRRGSLRACKHGRTWLVHKNDLQLTEAQRQSLMAHAAIAHDAVDACLPSRTAQTGERRSRSVLDLAAFAAARDVLVQVRRAKRADDRDVVRSADALVAGFACLAESVHEFDGTRRVTALRQHWPAPNASISPTCWRSCATSSSACCRRSAACCAGTPATRALGAAMQRNQDRAPAYVAAHELGTWLALRPHGDRQVRAAVRGLLVAIAEALTFPQRRLLWLRRADEAIVRLRVLLRLQRDVGRLDARTTRCAINQLDAIGRKVGGWLRDLRRRDRPSSATNPGSRPQRPQARPARRQRPQRRQDLPVGEPQP